MTELDRSWAESQIEAMADDSLSPEAARRMRSLMNIDAGIRGRVEAATALRRDLAALGGKPVPRGLLRRLWQIPGRHGQSRTFWMPVTAAATVAAVALTLGLYVSLQRPTPEELARDAAVQDFMVAMVYLQKSFAIAQNEVNEAVGSSVLSAFEVSREVMDTSQTALDEGDQEDVD